MKLEISPKRLRMSKKVKLKILKSETSVKVKLMATKREDQEAEAVLAVGDLQAEIKEDMKGRGLEAEATWDQDLVVGIVRKATGVGDPTAEVTKGGDLGVEVTKEGDPEAGVKIGITRGEVQENITENMTEGNATTTEVETTEKEVEVTRGVGH